MIAVADRRDAWVGSTILTQTITEPALVGMALNRLERNGALLGVHAEVWRKVLDNAGIVIALGKFGRGGTKDETVKLLNGIQRV